MNRSSFRKYLLGLVGATLVFTLAALPARAEMGMASPEEAKAASPVELTSSISPFFTATDAGHVANGCGLRNSAHCTINLRGIPRKSRVKKAFLYWAYTSTKGTASILQQAIFLNGFPVLGKRIGNGLDACWCGGTNVVYRANVTALVTGNGSYTVALLPGANTLTNGASPWDQTVCPAKKTEGLPDGASLVAVYTNSAETGTTVIYDVGLAGVEVTGAVLSYSLGSVPTPGSGESIFTEIAADGQIGSGYTVENAGKPTSVNSTVIAGLGGIDPDSDWDGTDGNPLNQLWDTHTHDVTGIITGGTSAVSIDDTVTSGLYVDCVIAVANVLTVR